MEYQNQAAGKYSTMDIDYRRVFSSTGTNQRNPGMMNMSKTNMLFGTEQLPILI